jgi:hypothetical protein
VEYASQMVPGTVDTDLDDVARDLRRAAIQFGQLAGGGNTASPGRQAGTEGIRDQGQGTILANGARLAGRLTHARRRSLELGVGVADIQSRQAPLTELCDHLVTRQPVVDDAPGGIGGTPTEMLDGLRPETHGPQDSGDPTPPGLNPAEGVDLGPIGYNTYGRYITPI